VGVAEKVFKVRGQTQGHSETKCTIAAEACLHFDGVTSKLICFIFCFLYEQLVATEIKHKN